MPIYKHAIDVTKLELLFHAIEIKVFFLLILTKHSMLLSYILYQILNYNKVLVCIALVIILDKHYFLFNI